MTTTLLSTARPDSNPGAAFAIRWSDSNGLSIPVNGGFLQSGGYWRNVSRANVMLVDNTTTYIEITQGGAIQALAGGFTTGNTPLYAISVASGIVTAIADNRFGQQTINGNTAPTYAVRKTLTDSQIKTLPSNSIQLVAAPGSGKMLVPIQVMYKANVQAGLYTNVEGTLTHGFTIGHVAAGVSLSGGITAALGTFILTDNSGDDFVIQTAIGLSDNDNTVQDLVSNHENQPLSLGFDNNGLGNFTGGNVANTLTVTLLYTTVETILT